MIIATYKLTPKIKGIHVNDAKFSLNKFFAAKCQETVKNNKKEKTYSFKNQESVEN
jgi:hypothetical protein